VRRPSAAASTFVEGATIRGPAPASPSNAYNGLIEVDPEHYEIERELSRGGMGRILLAHDRRLDRIVAIKEVGS
jgi:serine/threonine protein kinase